MERVEKMAPSEFLKKFKTICREGMNEPSQEKVRESLIFAMALLDHCFSVNPIEWRQVEG